MRDREFSDNFNAAAQRRGAVEQPEQASPLLIGRLRLDLVFYRHIVIPDTHLLDGRLFLAVPPARLSEATSRALGVRSPLQFPCRAGTLDESLAVLLSRNEHLNAFPFNCISDKSIRSAVANALGRADAQLLEHFLGVSPTIPAAVASVIEAAARDAGVDIDEDLELLRSGWEQWLQAGQLFKVHPYRNAYNLASGLAYMPRPVSIVSDTGRRFLPELASLLRDPAGRRSDVTRLLAAMSVSSDPTVSEDAVRLETWAERVRHVAIALQHEATYSYQLTAADPEMAEFELMARQVKPRNTAEMMDDVIARLAVLPDAKWREFNFHSRDDLEAWWTTGAADACSRALDCLSRLLQPQAAPDGRQSRSTAAMEIFSRFAVPAAGAAMGVSLGAATGLPVAEAAGIGAGGAQVLGAFVTRGHELRARRLLRRRLHRYFPLR
jgi:hypothetical protein